MKEVLVIFGGPHRSQWWY